MNNYINPYYGQGQIGAQASAQNWNPNATRNAELCGIEALYESRRYALEMAVKIQTSHGMGGLDSADKVVAAAEKFRVFLHGATAEKPHG